MKKKIVYTIPNFNTAGSGKALLNLALGLDKEIFDVEIVCKSDEGSFFKVVKDSGIPVHVFNYIPTRHPITKLFLQVLQNSLKWKRIKPDIVHSFHYSDNYTEAMPVRLIGAKWVFTKKNMSWGGSSGKGWQFRSRLANAIAVQNTDMIKQFYPTSSKLTLIPRGVNIQQFLPQPPKADIRKYLNTPEEARIIICVANMVPVKGVELLLQAFANLAPANPNWHVWLVGDINNDYSRQLIEQTNKYKLENRIHFAGKQSNVREYLDHAEIFVLPTKDEGRREGSPVALLEAMANGKVVLGSAVPGVRDQLANFDENQFEPGNWEDLRDKLWMFFKNSPEEMKLIGRKFQKHVMDNYSLTLEIQRHQAFYSSLF